MTDFLIPDEAHVQEVHLQTTDLPRLTQFYTGLLGFRQIHIDNNTVYLSASGTMPALVILTENKQLLPLQRQGPGLFHTAFLLPNRPALALLLKRLMEHGIRLGFGDHAVSEAIYLSDPDGNGVELYADRPRSMWPIKDGQVQMTTEPVDTVSLLNELNRFPQSWQGIDQQTSIGHIHLQVSSIVKAEQFYHKLLGFAVTQRSYPGALFVSAGGYHHHLGLNTWNSRNTAPFAADRIGLKSFTIQVPDKTVLKSIAGRLDEARIANSYTDETTLQCLDLDGIPVRIASMVDK